MHQQVVGFCELYMLVMGSWSVMGGLTLLVIAWKQEKCVSFEATTRARTNSKGGDFGLITVSGSQRITVAIIEGISEATDI